ncbi:hypothetical protein HDU67_008826, partial [Dinochytrium kinnereticum]
MSSFRNYNQPSSGSRGSLNDNDDDDWRDDQPSPQKAPPPATSVADRIARVGQKIPVSAQAPTPPVVASSYNSYASNQDSGVEYPRKTSVGNIASAFNKPSQPSNGGYQPPQRPTYPYPTATTTAPPKPVKLTPATTSPPEPATPSFANNPFVKTAAATPAAAPAESPSFSNNPFLKANTPAAPAPSYARNSPSVTLPVDLYETSASGMGINAQALAQRFPHFSASEISAFHQQFASFDKEGRGAVHQSDLSTVAPKAGEAYQNVVA